MRKETVFDSVGVQVMRSSWGGAAGELPRGWQSLDRPRVSFPEAALVMGGGASQDLAAPGGGMLLDKECEHGVRAGDDRGGVTLWLSFDPEVFDSVAGGSTLGRLRGTEESDRGRLMLVPDVRACWAVRATVGAADSGSVDPVACESLMYDVLASVCGGGAGGGRGVVTAAQREAVVRAVELLTSERNVTLGDVGRHVHTAPHHFCRVFKRCTGMTVQGFRRRVRLLRAAERVLRGGEALASVASACGYSDQPHMTRAFRRELGTPPGRLRGECASLAHLRSMVQDAGRAAV